MTEIIICVFLYFIVLICIVCFTSLMRLPSYRKLCVDKGYSAFVIPMKLLICFFTGSMLLRPFDYFKTCSGIELLLALTITTLLTFYLDRKLLYGMNYLCKIMEEEEKIKVYSAQELKEGSSKNE